GGFFNIDELVGSGDDTLTGLDDTATWQIGATDQYTSGGQTLGFSEFENLTGGSGADTFIFQGTARVPGLVDGGPNPPNAPDVADFSQATGPVIISPSHYVNIEKFILNGSASTLVGPDTPNTWIITGLNSGTLNGIPFSNVANLQGGSDTDTFLFEGGSLTGTIDGGGGVNTIDWSAVAAPQNVALTGPGL